MMKRRKPHYKRKNERLPKVTKCLGVNSIPVRVTTPHSRKVACRMTLRVLLLLDFAPWSLDGHYFESRVILRSFVVLCGLLVVAVIDDLVVVLGRLVLVEAEGINNSVARLRLKLLEHMTVN